MILENNFLYYITDITFFFTIFQMKAFIVLNIISLLIECIAAIFLGLVIASWRIVASYVERCKNIKALTECYCD